MPIFIQCIILVVVVAAVIFWAIHAFKNAIRTESAKSQVEIIEALERREGALIDTILEAVDRRREKDNQTMKHSLDEIRRDLTNLGIRLDKHLEREHPKP